MRKLWMVGCAALFLFSAAFVAGCGRSRPSGKLQIMYSGNLRGSVAPCGCHTPKGGIPRWAAYLNRQRNADASWLTVDAGNYVDRVGNGGCSGKCAFMVTSYRDLHYDVLNIGKQEAWMGKETLLAFADTLKTMQFVSANLVDRKSKRPIVKPTVIRDLGHIRVGIIGLLNEQDFPRGASLLDTTQLEVLPYLDAAKKYIPSLARKCDAVVVLAELPSQAIDSLVQVLPDIDLVITTGAAKGGEQMQIFGKKTRVVGTGSSGYVGHNIVLEFGVAGRDSIGIAASSDNLTDVYDEPGHWKERLDAFNAQNAATSTPQQAKSEVAPSLTATALSTSRKSN